MPYTRSFKILYPAVLGFAAALSVGAAASALAAEATVAVSPGSATGTVIGDACPTFTWGAVAEAKSYELVVYRLVEEGEEAQAVLRQSFPGSVYGWTPSLHQCLERGGEYAWSVRAVGEKATSEWSAPSLFEVTAGPSEAELEEALAVVKSYLETGGSGVALAGEVGGAEAQAGLPARVGAQPNQGETPGGRATGPSTPQPSALSNVQLTVDGDVMATAFGGDGSNLTGVIPAGAVMFFDRIACPPGWTVYSDAIGRYLVGAIAPPDQQLLGATVGIALDVAIKENRPVGTHGHMVSEHNDTHQHDYSDAFYSDLVSPPQPDHATPAGDDAGGLVLSIQTTSLPTAATHSHAAYPQGGVAGTTAPYVILTPCEKN